MAGTVSLKIGEGTARFRRATLCSSALNVVMLLSVVTTNLFALYAFTYSKPHPSSAAAQLRSSSSNHTSVISEHVSLILREIDFSQKKLSQMEKELLGYENIDLSLPNVPPELSSFLHRHPLPLGKDSRSGITELVSSVGHTCAASFSLLSNYMVYKSGSACPDDSHLALKLVAKGCEPLPRRRCYARTPQKMGLLPIPASLWGNVSDKVVSNWNGYACKGFGCLNGKKLGGACAGGCFDLGGNGAERQRWVKARSKNDFVIDEVLAMGAGNIRIGFDLGGGSGTFAARMAEKNVTIVTRSMNENAPFNEFISARGLFPLFLSLNHRFPFYNGVFDLVHASNGLGDSSQPEKLDFLMFDIDRILRVGGLFWLDNFHCADEEQKKTVTRLIERFGYKKVRWVVGEKAAGSSGTGKPQVYLSAVLQKPARG